MENFEKAKTVPKVDYTKPDVEKQQKAKARDYFLKKGEIKKYEAGMEEVQTGVKPLAAPEAAERHKKFLEGTVQKDILIEANKRKLLAGGSKPLSDYIQEVTRERLEKGNK